MKNLQVSKAIWRLTIPLFAGIIFSSLTGMVTQNFYDQETLNWQIQCKGQDIVDLFLVSPLLLVSAWLASSGNRMALLVWAGTNLYLAYTFLIFCFAVHFNSLFLVYCMNLGLAVYSLLFFLFHLQERQIEVVYKKKLFRITSVFFLVIAVLFYGLWLSGILPSLMTDSVPKEIEDIGMPVNPVHVIDLSMLLPAVFISGILLWKNHPVGIRLAPVFLSFFVLMNITIAVLNNMMHQMIPSTNGAISWVMMGLAIVSFILGYQFLPVFRQRKLPSYEINPS